MTTHNFCFYLQNWLIQTSQTGGQQYSDTSPFSIPWLNPCQMMCMQYTGNPCLLSLSLSPMIFMCCAYRLVCFRQKLSQWWNQGSLTERNSTVDLLVLACHDKLLFILEILFTIVTKQATLLRRLTVLSLSLHLVFPAYTNKKVFQFFIFIRLWTSKSSSKDYCTTRISTII